MILTWIVNCLTLATALPAGYHSTRNIIDDCSPFHSPIHFIGQNEQLPSRGVNFGPLTRAHPIDLINSFSQILDIIFEGFFDRPSTRPMYFQRNRNFPREILLPGNLFDVEIATLEIPRGDQILNTANLPHGSRVAEELSSDSSLPLDENDLTQLSESLEDSLNDKESPDLGENNLKDDFTEEQFNSKTQENASVETSPGNYSNLVLSEKDNSGQVSSAALIESDEFVVEIPDDTELLFIGLSPIDSNQVPSVDNSQQVTYLLEEPAKTGIMSYLSNRLQANENMQEKMQDKMK